MRMCTERNSQIARMGFFMLSACGWVLFLIGFGLLEYTIRRHPDPDASESISKTLTGPMWLFLVSTIFLYVIYLFQIFKSSNNMGHILHSIMAFFNFFYTSSGTLTLSVGILYQLEAIKVLLVTSLPHAVGMKLILIGSAVSLVMFWIGLGIWPLFSLERRRYRGYTELQEN